MLSGEAAFFCLAAGFYAAATGFALTYLFSREERWSLWMFRLLAAGVLLHTASFGLRLSGFWAAPENRYFFPIHSFFGALSYMSLAVALTFAVVEGRYRLGILGAFVLPWACLGAWAALWRAHSVGSTELAGLDPALRSYWMNLHPMVLMTAYSVLANAFGVGLALLIQEYQIKSRRPSELCYRLPAIEELDGLNYRLIASAFPVLAAGIGMGVLWADQAWGRLWVWDAKVIWAVITAAVYASFLAMRWTAGWRGRKAVYVSMLGFACVLFTFAAVNFLSQMHGYLSQG